MRCDELTGKVKGQESWGMQAVGRADWQAAALCAFKQDCFFLILSFRKFRRSLWAL